VFTTNDKFNSSYANSKKEQTLPQAIKKLPMKYPFITSHPTDANLLSIFSRDEEITWFLNHFIMLSVSVGYKDSAGLIVDNHIDYDISRYPLLLLRNCPLIYFHGMSKTYVNRNHKNVTEFIISAINDGYYVYLFIETTCIRAYENYGSGHSQGHDLLIYGYNLTERTFNIADFFVNKYSYETCSFAELEDAYNNADFNYYENSVFLIKKSNRYQSRIDVRLAKLLIGDYLSNKNTANLISRKLNFHDDSGFTYGRGVYDSLANLINNDPMALWAMVKPIHVMYDHKVLMLRLIKQLHSEGYLPNDEHMCEQMQVLISELQTFKNLALKFLLKNKLDKPAAINKLTQISKMDADVFSMLYDSISEKAIPLNHGLTDIYCKVRFLSEDRSTGKGTEWTQTYGKDGYYVVGYPAVKPNNIKYRICNANFILHAEPDNRALLVPNSDLPIGTGVLYNHNKFYIDFYAEHATQVTFYFYNYERDIKIFCIDIIDLKNDEKIIEYTPINFEDGLYASFIIQGHARLVFRNTGRTEDYSNAVVCAIFFDAITS